MSGKTSASEADKDLGAAVFVVIEAGLGEDNDPKRGASIGGGDRGFDMEPSLSIDTRLEADTRAVASTLAQEDRAEPMHCIGNTGYGCKSRGRLMQGRGRCRSAQYRSK